MWLPWLLALLTLRVVNSSAKRRPFAVALPLMLIRSYDGDGRSESFFG